MLLPESHSAMVGASVHNKSNHPLVLVDACASANGCVCSARYRGDTPSLFAVKHGTWLCFLCGVKALAMMPISSPATRTGARSTIGARTVSSGRLPSLVAMRGTGTSIPAMRRSTGMRMTSRTGYRCGASRTCCKSGDAYSVAVFALYDYSTHTPVYGRQSSVVLHHE